MDTALKLRLKKVALRQLDERALSGIFGGASDGACNASTPEACGPLSQGQQTPHPDGTSDPGDYCTNPVTCGGSNCHLCA